MESDKKQRQDKNAGDQVGKDEINGETTENYSNSEQDQEIPENKKEEARISFENFNRSAMNG